MATVEPVNAADLDKDLEAAAVDESKVSTDAVAVPAGGAASGAVSAFPSLENDPRVQHLYHIAKGWASNRSVDAGTIILFATSLIASVENLITEAHAGPYKKQVLLTVLRLVLENDVQWSSEAAKATVVGLLETTIPIVIDTTIGIAKGEIDIGKIFKRFSPCCFGVNPKEHHTSSKPDHML